MGCGCGARSGAAKSATGSAPGAAPQARSYAPAPAMMRLHVGPASNPATNAAGVKTAPDAFAGVTAMMRAAVVSSRLVVFPRISGSVQRGAMGRVGAVIVPATTAVPVVSVRGYAGQLPFDAQPNVVKPKPWAMGGR